MPSGFNVNVPLLGWVLPVIVKGSPSGSESLGNTDPFTGVSNSVVTKSSTASGGLFTTAASNSGSLVETSCARIAALAGSATCSGSEKATRPNRTKELPLSPPAPAAAASNDSNRSPSPSRTAKIWSASSRPMAESRAVSRSTTVTSEVNSSRRSPASKIGGASGVSISTIAPLPVTIVSPWYTLSPSLSSLKAPPSSANT